MLFVANVDWFFISHRLVIAEEALKRGFEVFVAAENTGSSKEILDKGIQFIDLPISRSGINPIKELRTVIDFFRVYRRVCPDIVHHITLKPVIYGSIIAKLLKIKCVINAVSGLGFNFTEDRKRFISRIMLSLMRYGFRRDLSVIFQNRDDYNELTQFNVLSKRNRVYFIKGSGVNLSEFYPVKLPDFKQIKIVLPSRMLSDKGIAEFHEAARILKEKYYEKVQFILAGRADEDNNAGLSSVILNKWNDLDYFKWVGHQSNIFQIYENAHIVVLPSYREGMPRSLIEACAMGRAIITTDAIGCRECVDQGVNGLKVPVKDAKSLALAIEFLIKHPNRIIEMGIASRLKAESEFDIKAVINAHFMIYKGCH